MASALHTRRRITATSSRQLSDSGVKRLVHAYRTADFGAVEEGWTPKPGFVYTACRAISARVNQNFDAWPSEELKKSYRTFIGKPVFVNHQNFDPKKARGKVIAARYLESGDDRYIETIMETDAQRFPKLAKELREGGLDSVSMGVEAGFTICSACDKKAVDEHEFCDHVRHHKGKTIRVKDAKTGKMRDQLVYEDCFKLGFFELSYVFDPADETAVVSRVMVANNRTAAGYQDDEEEGLLDITELDRDPYSNGATPESEKNPTFYDSSDFTFSDSAFSGGGGASPAGSTSGSGGSPDAAGILPQSRGLYDSILADHPDLEIGGYRVDDYHEHDSGALDVMTTDDAVARSVMQKAFDSGAPYALWQQTQWNADGSSSPMEDRLSPTQNHMDHVHTAPIPAGRSARRRLAYGETKVPRDIDTLSDDDNDSLDDYQFVEPVHLGDEESPFEHWLESPPELTGPDFDETKRLDRQQEAEGLDGDRLVENFGEVDGDPDFEDAPPRRMTMGRARTRTAAPRKRAADEDPVLEELEEVVGEDLDGDGEAGESEEHAEKVLGEDDSDDDSSDDDDSDDDSDDEDCSGDDAEESIEDDLQILLANRAQRRRSAKSRRRTNNKGQGQKGRAMSPASRKAANRRQHTADTSGHTDGGPYGRNDQGELEDVHLSETPGTEAVEAPTGDESKITNTEGNLVASIRAKSADLQRDIARFQKLQASKPRKPYRATVEMIAALPPHQRKAAAEHMARAFKQENPRFAPRKFYAAITQRIAATQRTAEAVARPETVNPALSGTDEQSLKGNDFDSVALDDVETQPKDASKKAFAAFDAWLRQTTDRTAAQHSPEFLRRQATRWAAGNRLNVQVLYPTLGNVLREARKGEAARGANMKRKADESLEVAAPDARVDFEAPFANVTDADAQASQYDLHDYGDNAGDDLANPELSSDSQIWAPGEKSAQKMASGASTVRYAEAMISMGLAKPEDRWKLARQAETQREAVIIDRTNLLEAAIAAQGTRTRTAAAAVSRGPAIPRGITAPRVAMTKVADNDPINDSALFL